MAVNKYAPHLFIIPEDDANRQLAVGFEKSYRVKSRAIQVMPPAKGWGKAVAKVEDDYILKCRNNSKTHVVLLIDCDGDASRLDSIRDSIPDDVAPQIFVFGTAKEPEVLRKSVGKSLEKIGDDLAAECDDLDSVDTWSHEQLAHNKDERNRAFEVLSRVILA